MKNFYKVVNVTVMLMCVFSFSSVYAEENKIKQLKTGPKSELYISDAAFYKTKGERAIVFVPGFIFNKESWGFLASQFQSSGTASLAVNGKSATVVKAAVNFLNKKGYSEIVLVGGSSGAAAILEALPNVSGVSKVVLLAPPRGAPIESGDIDKLFVTSADENLFPKVNEIFDGTSHPKTLKIFDGSAHAQFLFYGPNKAELVDLITNFIND
jgi:pimeloyl-ACP methyl ester carboxylesterase